MVLEEADMLRFFIGDLETLVGDLLIGELGVLGLLITVVFDFLIGEDPLL